MRILAVILLAITLVVTAAAQPAPPLSLAQRAARFAPTPLGADLSGLSAGDKVVLKKLIEVSAIFDTLYLRQAWSGNLPLLAKLSADQSAEGKDRLHYFLLNMSPWSGVDGNTPFIDGVPAARPKGANYYPEDMTAAEFDQWAGSLSEKDLASAKGYFTVIRRDNDRHLTIVPYNAEYRPLLERASRLMKEAAASTEDASLKRFLTSRAEAFLSNNYVDSDIDWMDLDSQIEPTIGPYEVYLDDLFNYKAAFEAYVGIRDKAESGKLSLYSAHLQEIEDHLPIDPSYRNPKLGAASPIRVIDELAVGGEARAGVQTAAFNLPNDAQVVEKKGSKRVLLKNVQEAKFTSCLVPIAAVAVSEDQRSSIAFEPFFTHILAHELMHGLGPQMITVDGRKVSVHERMKELGSALEEAKADISGLFALQYLIDHNILPASLEQPLYATFLASVFRSVRFGIEEAHGKGTALQFNYLTDEGGFVFDERSGAFRVDYTKIKQAVAKLTGVIMTIQAEGSYAKAKALLGQYGVIRPQMQGILNKLSGVPIDIEPVFSPIQ